MADDGHDPEFGVRRVTSRCHTGAVSYHWGAVASEQPKW